MVSATMWKTGLALAALFGLGVACGVVVARHWPGKRPAAEPLPAAGAAATNRPPRVENLARKWGENRKASYMRAIKPTAEQAEAIERHFMVLSQEVARIQTKTKGEIQEALRHMHRDIEAELKPAQRRAFQERLKKMEKAENY